MLIIIAGAESIGKRIISRSIISTMNTFTFEDWNIKFTFDFDGNVITTGTRGEEVVDLSDARFNSLKYGSDVLNYAESVYEEIFQTGIKVWHTFDAHLDIDYDIGATMQLEQSDLMHDIDVISVYRQSPLDVHVATGSFSSYYLDEVRAALGPDNVKIYNIVRHPSVSALMDYKHKSFYDSPLKPDLDAAVNKIKFFESTVGSALLSNIDYVTTLRFEDIIQTSTINVNGTEVELGLGYKAHNAYISEYELKNHTEQNLSYINGVLSNVNLEDWYPREDFSSDDHFNAMVNAIPTNLFESLGYEPLTYEEIVKKR